jgi:hypothetical protein
MAFHADGRIVLTANHNAGSLAVVDLERAVVKPIHRIPVERFPNALAIMSPQEKQSEHAVDRHGGTRRWPPEKRCTQAGAPFSSVSNFVHHNVSRTANKSRYRRVEWCGHLQAPRPAFGRQAHDAGAASAIPVPASRCIGCSMEGTLYVVSHAPVQQVAAGLAAIGWTVLTLLGRMSYAKLQPPELAIDSFNSERIRCAFSGLFDVCRGVRAANRTWRDKANWRSRAPFCRKGLSAHWILQVFAASK